MANSTLTRDIGRQSALTAMLAITFGHINDSAVAVKAIDLPYGAVITGGFIIVDEVFNVATSSVLDIGDLTTPNRYANDVNLKALGVTQLTITGYTSDGDAIYILPVNVGAAATTGKARIFVSYTILNRASEIQPN
jgi:hypothetical protein